MNPRNLISSALCLLVIISAILWLPSPLYAISISLNPGSGTVGSQIALAGDGFIGKLATIYWDGNKLVQNVPITQGGQINYTFEIPPSAKGQHTVKVSDDSNWSTITATSSFTVTPGIATNPPWARPGNSVIIFGSGFEPNETNIVTIWDDKSLSHGIITADRIGSWNDMFTVPDVPKGEYYIQAWGDHTQASDVQKILFTVTPFCKAQPLSGPVGTEVTITGVGFRAGEDGITFTWDGPIIDTNFVARPNGSFSYSIIVPPSVKGRHIIGIYGSSFTPRGIVPDIMFEVTPSIVLTPSYFINSRDIDVDGAGFNGAETISISLNKAATGVSATTTADGSFHATIQRPANSGKELTVTATGNKGAVAQTSVTISMTAPPAPSLVSPKSNTSIQNSNSVADVIGGIFKYIASLPDLMSGSSQKGNDAVLTTMSWSVDTDQTGLKYVLQIARTQDFTSPAIQKDGLTSNSYTLMQSSLPGSGIFFWRVKAVDDIGDESQWSNTSQFEIVQASTLVVALSVTIILLILALIFFAIMALISKIRSS